MELTEEILKDWFISVLRDSELTDCKPFTSQNFEFEEEDEEDLETFDDYVHRTADDYNFARIKKLSELPFESLSDIEKKRFKT